MKKTLMAFLAIHAAASCGGVDVQNQPPIVIGFIEPIALFVNETHEIVVSDIFSDPDGDLLTYTVSNSDPDNLEAALSGEMLVVKGIGGTVATVTLIATDIHDAQASLAFEVTVTDALRDDFDSDQGWIGITGLEPTPEIVRLRDGHLDLTIGREYVAQYALRDIGTTGPNWKVSSRLTTESPSVCYGIMAFSQVFKEGVPPDFVWGIDLDPFGGWFSSLYLAELGDWAIIDSGDLPRQQDFDGYVEISIGYTEENVFYGYAFGDFKLFEFDLDALEGLEKPPNTIEHIAASGTPCEVGGVIRYDWMEVSIQQEGL